MADHNAPSMGAARAPVQQGAAGWRRRHAIASVCVLASSLWACGGGAPDLEPGNLDLGGGISMTPEGAIVVAPAS